MMEKPILFNTEMVRAILDGRKTQTRRLIRPQPEGQMCYVAAGSHYGKWHHMSEDCARAWDVDLSRISKGKDRYWKSPYDANDRLYVRETWKQATGGTAGPGLFDTFLFKADEPQDTTGLMAEGCWHPSIHMPKAAARIWLEVNRVRVERLQDITEEDAKAEGISRVFDYLSDEQFQNDIVRFDPDAKKEAFGWTNYLHGDRRDTYGYSDYQSPVDSFGSLWDSTVRIGDMEQYGWNANPWVWVIEFERVEGKHDEH